MTCRAVTIYVQTHPVDGRAWLGLAEGQTNGDMKAPSGGTVHTRNDLRLGLEVRGGAGRRRVRDHIVRTMVHTLGVRGISGFENISRCHWYRVL